MRSAFATLAIFVAQAAAFEVNSSLEQRFVEWTTRHGKQYATMVEFGHRLQNWIKTDKEIERVNNKKGETVVLGHNKFSDLTDEEYRAMLTYVPRKSSFFEQPKPTILDVSNIPDSINWVEQGAVNSVQDQGQCGSCWAFSAIASMEGSHFVKSGQLLKLSEQ